MKQKTEKLKIESPPGVQAPASGMTFWRPLLCFLGVLAVFRLGTFIPIPGIDLHALALLTAVDALRDPRFDFYDMLTGGALGRVSLFTLGVMPYIAAFLIVQLFALFVPQLKGLKNHGRAGRQQINQYARYLAVGFALMQSWALAGVLQNLNTIAGMPVVTSPGTGFVLTTMLTMTTGTVFLMWLAEQITKRGIGNGFLFIILAGMAANFPWVIGSLLEHYRATGPTLYIVSNLSLMSLVGVPLAALGLALFVLRRTRMGSDWHGLITEVYAKECRLVWPPLPEVLKAALVIMAWVLFLAIYLFLLDGFLSSMAYALFR